MKTVNKIKVSPKAWNVTVFYDDGTKENIPFENFLRCFGDYRKSVYEYMTYVFVRTSAHEAIKEIKAKLLPS
ncbi:MAG: hypothetical protein QW186_08740 [Candidatus Bathyarchaeia archaeon]